MAAQSHPDAIVEGPSAGPGTGGGCGQPPSRVGPSWFSSGSHMGGWSLISTWILCRVCSVGGVWRWRLRSGIVLKMSFWRFFVVWFLCAALLRLRINPILVLVLTRECCPTDSWKPSLITSPIHERSALRAPLTSSVSLLRFCRLYSHR